MANICFGPFSLKFFPAAAAATEKSAASTTSVVATAAAVADIFSVPGCLRLGLKGPCPLPASHRPIQVLIWSIQVYYRRYRIKKGSSLKCHDFAHIASHIDFWNTEAVAGPLGLVKWSFSKIKNDCTGFQPNDCTGFQPGVFVHWPCPKSFESLSSSFRVTLKTMS